MRSYVYMTDVFLIRGDLDINNIQRKCHVKTERGWQFASQRKRSQKKPKQPTPFSWTSSLQNCESPFLLFKLPSL